MALADTRKLAKDGSLIANYFQAATRQLSSIGSVIEQDMVMKASNFGSLAGVSVLGVSGLFTYLNYYLLSQEKNPSDHVKFVKKTLVADMVSQLGASATAFSAIVGPSTVQSALSSQYSIASAGATVLGSVFIGSLAVLLGTNLLRTYSANSALKQDINARDDIVKESLGENTPLFNSYKALSESKKEAVIHAALSGDFKPLDKNTTQQELSRALQGALKLDSTEQLKTKFKSVKANRFARNSSLQKSLTLGIVLSISFAAIAFPPAAVPLTAAAFLTVSIKFGWDLYRKNQHKINTKELNQAFSSNQKDEQSQSCSSERDNVDSFVNRKKALGNVLKTSDLKGKKEQGDKEEEVHSVGDIEMDSFTRRGEP